jgi:hypothetical protein
VSTSPSPSCQDLTAPASPLSREANTQSAVRRRLLDWGDRFCCALLLVASLGGVALLGWYVWQMPAVR